MTRIKIPRGSNRLIDLPLYEEDDTTPILVVNLTLATLELWQGNTRKHLFTVGIDAVLREGQSTNIVRFELTRAISGALSLGELRLKYTIEINDVRFTVDSDTHNGKAPCSLIEMVDCY